MVLFLNKASCFCINKRQLTDVCCYCFWALKGHDIHCLQYFFIGLHSQYTVPPTDISLALKSRKAFSLFPGAKTESANRQFLEIT